VVRRFLIACACWVAAAIGAVPAVARPPDADQRPTLLRNGTLWTATGAVLQQADLVMQAGRIAAVGKGLAAPAGARVLDLGGKIVTPGLVDMHSHLGVYPAPHGRAKSDGNEMTAPLTPFVRAIDAFDPEDIAIARAVGGGVTTALILPGSGNVMGGQALYVKLFGKTVAHMQIAGAPRAMKWAMGENPKRVYGERTMMPMARLGHAWLMRQRLAEARDLKDQQARWDRDSKDDPKAAPRPNRADLEPLVALLRGEVSLQVHCYEVHDIETLLRVAEEFNFKVAAIHHALEAWKVPQLLKERKVAVATFSDLWGFKMEAYDASVWGPKILEEAGVRLALKTDHPVIDARWFIFEAAKSHHYGLSEQAALQAVTRNPAQAIGLGDRIGTLEPNKEADVVVWPGSPFAIGAQPERVFIDGAQVVGDGANLQAAWSTDARPNHGVCGCGH